MRIPLSLLLWLLPSLALAEGANVRVLHAGDTALRAGDIGRPGEKNPDDYRRDEAGKAVRLIERRKFNDLVLKRDAK